MHRSWLFIPLLLFLLLAWFFATQLIRNSDREDPTRLESALIGKPLPPLPLPEGTEQQSDRKTLLGQGEPFLLNVWATWCSTCLAEHHFLNTLAAKRVRIVGLNYKDDRQSALQWLQQRGNPYALTLFDSSGMAGLDLGVYGAPETFLIDGAGIIRYRHVGALNQAVWQEQLRPRYQHYLEQTE